ncbi:MAG: penicillin-binding protein [Roseburia sp.]|nr:penicillin-binding protein [Anaeroplasma bactoclasticum]MCM1196432.1 penicillin-binding protein [Roseburia sp.]MCM1557583.1 penicillin-binding protein [Anaeroplasma bactoclasticum]
MKKKVIISLPFIFLFFILFLFFFQPIDTIQDIHTSPEISIVDANNKEILHLIQKHKTTPIDLSKMSKQNISILLDIEDKNFYKHSGFNLNRIFKTIFSNIKNNEKHGASTITQQYVKNVYLNNKKSLGRKLKELYYAIKLEQAASKEEILTGYLNCIYLGNDIYGIANAAKYYFNTCYEDLTVQQMTTIVALLNAPSYYSSNLEELENKKNSLLSILLSDGMITQDEYEKALAPIQFHITPKIYNSHLLYYTDEVLKEYTSLNLNSKFNKTITIKTKYNEKMNQLFPTTTANYASMVVDKDGYILSMIGNKNYYESTYNIVTQGTRDIGSTIKPILYYEALKCGFSTTTAYYSAPYTFSYHNELVTINNNASIYPYKNITMREALATSDNIYAIKTHQALGFKTLANHFKAYNIKASSLPSLALGSVGMSLYDLTRIYSQFFTEGIYLEFKYIETVHREEQVIYARTYKHKKYGEEKYFKEIKNLMSSIFDTSIPHSTASSISKYLKTKCYGKSGLTDYDSYMVGFNDDILIGIWAGYLDNQPLEDSSTKRLPKEIFVKLLNAYYTN